MMRVGTSQKVEHLIGVPESQWAFWRWACLRSAGFPANGILKLAASPSLLSDADEAIKAAQTLELARDRVREEIRSALDQLRTAGQWDDKKKRKELLRAIARINEQKPLQVVPEMVSGRLMNEFSVAMKRAEDARAIFHQNFSECQAKTSASIREIVGSARFSEALTWQNRAAVQTALFSLARNSCKSSTRNSDQRQHEELAASYWQRYCTKNDTIGFFGPVGWIQVSTEHEYLVTRPGAQLLATRKTYWESWAIEALGAVLQQKYNLQPWIPPFLMPFVRLQGTFLHHPIFGSRRISPKQSALLRACNGRDTAKQIAARLVRLPEPRFQGTGEIYTGLQELADRGLIFWKFNIPLDPHSDQVLREALHRIDDPHVRMQTLGVLDEFDAVKARVEASADDHRGLGLALEDLERSFTEITGLPATRSHGKVYAGRTLVYEDCRRDVEIFLGKKLFKSLVEPLSLLLASGRWFTAQVAESFRKKLLEIYTELVNSTGSSTVDAALYWMRIMPYFYEDARPLLDPLEEEFRMKWERILQVGSGSGQVTYSCEELRDRIQQEFPSEGRSWINARYHSPDVMIAASSEEAIRQGDYFFVLGEVHVGVNTLQSALFGAQHPSPNELINAVQQDLGAFNVVPVGARRQQTTTRIVQWLIPKSNLRLEYLPDLFATDRSKALPISSIVIERQNGELMARTRDRKLCLNLLDLLGGLLSTLVIDCFRIIVPRRYTPRIAIDRLIIKRESWHFSPSELQFAQCSYPAERFLQARSWAQAQGIPRFAFFKVPVEKKPTFLDFESPILLDIFSKMVRRTMEAALPNASIDISEMLPSMDQLWLTDADNQRYTSELRFVAVNPKKTKYSDDRT